MIEASDSTSADALTSPENEPPSAAGWNGRSLVNIGDEQTQPGNALEEIRRQVAAQGLEQLALFDNCLITYIAFYSEPNAPLATRVADLKKLMLARQIDPQIVDLLKV